MEIDAVTYHHLFLGDVFWLCPITKLSKLYCQAQPSPSSNSTGLIYVLIWDSPHHPLHPKKYCNLKFKLYKLCSFEGIVWYGRQPYGKTTPHEDDLTGRQPCRKTSSEKDSITSRQKRNRQIEAT